MKRNRATTKPPSKLAESKAARGNVSPLFRYFSELTVIFSAYPAADIVDDLDEISSFDEDTAPQTGDQDRQSDISELTDASASERDDLSEIDMSHDSDDSIKADLPHKGKLVERFAKEV